MDYDDNYQRIRVNVKMTAKGEAQVDVTSENLVKGMFKSADEKSGKILENIQTTASETFEALDKATQEANSRGIKCTHQTLEQFEEASKK